MYEATETSNDDGVQASVDNSEYGDDEEKLPLVEQKWPFERENGLPLICCHSCDMTRKSSLLVDIFRQETTMARISFSFGCCYYTNNGWLLYLRPEMCSHDGIRFLLHNIRTGAQVQLPILGYRPGSGRTCFTTSGSTPSYIFYMFHDPGNHRTYTHVTRPGDTVWKEHIHWHGLNPTFDFVDLILIGTKVFCFDHSDKISVFDLEANCWLFISGVHKDQYHFYVTEIEGVIVKLSPPNQEFRSYRFYKLLTDDVYSKGTWVEVGREELGNRSWFLNYKGGFSVEGCSREAVYWFHHELPNGKRHCSYGEKINFYLDVYDFAEGTTQTRDPFDVPSTAFALFWVNMGNSNAMDGAA